MATQIQFNPSEFNILKDSTLLYLEDDEIIRKETISIFESFFKKIYSAEDGKLGLEEYHLHKKEIDIILTDINMPKMNGIEFMSEIRKENNDLPILIITSFNDVNQIIKAIRYKVADYIIKPMQINTTLKIFTRIFNDRLNKKLVKKQQKELSVYKKILDTENLVSETDLKGVITYANDIFCEVSGYTREELIGQPHNIVRHPDVSPKIYEKLWEQLQSGNSWSGKLKNLKKNGEAYFVKATIFPIFDSDGNAEKYVATRFVITDEESERHKLKKYIMQQKGEQVKYEKGLQDKYEEAVHFAKMQKDQQVASILHELNEQIKILRIKNSDDKGRVLFLERKLKESLDKNDELQIAYQKRIEKLHKTAIVAVEQYKALKKKNSFMSEKIEKSQEGIVTLQAYIDEYRKKIENLEDVIATFEKEHGTLGSIKNQ